MRGAGRAEWFLKVPALEAALRRYATAAWVDMDGATPYRPAAPPPPAPRRTCRPFTECWPPETQVPALAAAGRAATNLAPRCGGGAASSCRVPVRAGVRRRGAAVVREVQAATLQSRVSSREYVCVCVCQRERESE